jgi:two-component system, NarL family, sensor kinase
VPEGQVRRGLIPAEVLRFVVSVLVVTAAIGIAIFLLLSQQAISEAQRGAEDVARVQGVGVVEPLLTDGLLSGDSATVATIDRVVRSRVLDARTVRVKIWDVSGKILYSDEPRLIGTAYTLGADERAAIAQNLIDSSVSDLTRPENQYERRFGKLLEVYLPLKTPSGQKVLFETYQEFASVQAQQQRIMLQFGPVLVGGLVLLLLLEVPLAWSMARGLQRASLERETLLSRAVNASEGERRRIARDLHDGVVQRLAGTSMSLAAAGLDREGGKNGQSNTSASEVLQRNAAEIREAIRELRSLIVKIAPTGLTGENLHDALTDLGEPLRASGVAVEVKATPVQLGDEQALLVFRVAQEALRNVARHARATHVTIEVSTSPSGCQLVVSDDGKGFDPNLAAARQKDGHLGLALLHSLAEDGGGRLRVGSVPGQGSRVEMTLP